MAETCIVCLGDLALPTDPEVATTDESLSPGSDDRGVVRERKPSLLEKLATPPQEPIPDDSELVACLQPCRHNLHHECLKPWVERANSCPICRAAFNTVELSTTVGGPILSSYSVEDKQQRPEVDPFMFIEDEYPEEEEVGEVACIVCEEMGNPRQLMFCAACDQLCHVFCAGLDTMPSYGPWYCQHCMENPELLAAGARRSIPNGPAAFRPGRSRPRRHTGRNRRGRSQSQDEWSEIWHTTWNRLHFDVDFPFDEEEPAAAEAAHDAQRREMRQWEQRFEIARQNGAANQFSTIANQVLRNEAPKTPVDPESQEEIRAWNAFEKAREQLKQMEAEGTRSTDSNHGGNHRKRKSVSSSPREPEPRVPERKFKRPRTRLHQEIGESSAAGASRPPQPKLTLPNPQTPGESNHSGGFLQSLLKEYETKHQEAADMPAPQPRRIIRERACSPQGSSPGLSPIYSTPLPGTPPPALSLSRPLSPQQQQHSSPMHSPTYSPYSPADNEPRSSRRQRAPLSSPPRSKDASPTRPGLSYSTKAEIQRMVTAALKPLYVKKEVDKDQYTDINRDVSRLMYDRIADAGPEALVHHTERDKWQQMAGDEVRLAIEVLKAKDENSRTAGINLPVRASKARAVGSSTTVDDSADA